MKRLMSSIEEMFACLHRLVTSGKALSRLDEFVLLAMKKCNSATWILQMEICQTKTSLVVTIQ